MDGCIYGHNWRNTSFGKNVLYADYIFEKSLAPWALNGSRPLPLLGVFVFVVLPSPPP